MNGDFTPANPRGKAEFHARLAAWYGRKGRKSLPWRTTNDPYHIYLSEVMLQQTQVATVLERYYFPFLQRFPTLEALAAAPREDVLKAWQGLGYYNRAANLHAAAQQAVGRYGSALPGTVEGLLALPGVGRNTAHAVGAFAFRLPVPVMEANVKRVLYRIFALTQASDAQLWACAESLLNPADPFDYNQAMMDLGAMVCTKRAPKCSECPANSICKGQDAPETYPAPKQAKQTPVRRRAVVVLRDMEGRIHAAPREGKFLRGMYQFLEYDADAPRSAADRFLGRVTQVYSHFTLEAEVFVRAVGDARGPGWFTLAEFSKLPHSKAEEKMLVLLEAAALPMRTPAAACC